jgi:hypothetical protein
VFEVVDADVDLSPPFYPAYMTPERFAKAAETLRNRRYWLRPLRPGCGNEHKVTVAESPTRTPGRGGTYRDDRAYSGS